jgi:HPt (histidine-containing phosphotransfer) domain-containing protein
MSIHVADCAAHRWLATLAGAEDAPPEAVDLGVLAGLEGLQDEGEPSLVVELIDLYLEEAPRQLASMFEAEASADADALRRAAHSLKGSSASLGAFGAAALCGELEHADCGDSSRGAGELIARLGQELERVRRVFAAERRKRT